MADVRHEIALRLCVRSLAMLPGNMLMVLVVVGRTAARSAEHGSCYVSLLRAPTSTPAGFRAQDL